VTDPAGVANISHVYADVYYPQSGPVDPGPNGSLKFEVELNYFSTGVDAESWFNSACDAFMVRLWDGITRADIEEELSQQSARLFAGSFHFDNCQLAGDYTVTISAVNRQNVHGILTDTLQWLPLTAAEWDFNNVNYGSVAIGVHKQIDGDYTWNTNAGANRATLRNIGNTYLQMTVKGDDMGLGKTIIGGVPVWNVHYDGRMGSDPLGYENFDPAVTKGGNLAAATATTLPQILRLCALDKVDFSIRIDKDSIPGANHSYRGNVILGVVISSEPPADPNF
jgi:hypothetical protein